jgi:hypothetical protein
VRRVGLYAAGLILAVFLALTLAAASGARAPVAHTCSVTDRQFIAAAQTNMTALGLWAQQYQSGDTPADDLVSEARNAAKIVAGTSPTDTSLAATRGLMVSMFREYAEGVREHARGRSDAAQHVNRAYLLANSAHDVLEAAAAGLGRRGCDVRPLL